MTHFHSKKWRIFASRPTSILKRDFMKWTYLSIGKIRGFKLTKVLTVGDEQEMDIYVNHKEDKNNYSRIAEQYEKGEVEKVLRFYDNKILGYKPAGKDEISRSLHAMKSIGPVLIYSFYLESFLEKRLIGESERMLLTLNSRLRDRGAKIIYPLCDKACDALMSKYKNRAINSFTLNELKQIPEELVAKERRDFYVFLGTTKDSSVYTGIAAKKFLNKEGFVKMRRMSAGKLSGLSASVGKVRGVVKIIRGINDIEHCVGKVVVCRETIIEYTPMLKKNLAIVTDFGGISSHAAVTAREFQIPCVVGTKYATEVFKDGDLVEVDAEKGIVKILKRK